MSFQDLMNRARAAQPQQAQARPMNPAAPRQFGMGQPPAQRGALMSQRPQMPQQARPMPQQAQQGYQRRPMMAGGASMGGAMMSDEHSKKRIQELESLNAQYEALADSGPAAQLAKTSSNSYEYKDPGAAGAAPGRHAGPMAHELEGIPGVVQPGPDGMKRVDTGRLALATASATGDQERRLRELEQSAFNDPGEVDMDRLMARLNRDFAALDDEPRGRGR
jgi:hypothetical protein